MVLGLLNIGIFQALLFVAAYRLPGGVAATVIATQPLAVVMLSRTILRVRLTWFAAIFGLVGVGLVVLSPSARLDTLGVIAALTGAVSMAWRTRGRPESAGQSRHRVGGESPLHGNE